MSQGTVNGIPLSRSMSSSSTNNFVVLSAKAIYDWAIGLFAPKSNPTFTGNVVLPSTLTIGGITYSSIFYNRKIYNYQNTDSSVTGSTNQTVLANLLITGGDIGINGKILFFNQLRKTGTAGNFTVRMYLSTDATNTVGTTGTPTNSTLIGTRGTGAANLTGGVMSRQMQNKNSASLNEVFPTAVDSGVDTATSTTAMTTTNINTAVNLYYVITGQLSSAADTGILCNTQIYIDKP